MGVIYQEFRLWLIWGVLLWEAINGNPASVHHSSFFLMPSQESFLSSGTTAVADTVALQEC